MNFLQNIRLHPSDYESSAFLAHEVGEELIARLDLMKLNPKTALDIGCGPGNVANALQKRYKNADIVALDLSESMLFYAQKQSPHLDYICADALTLPIRASSIDMLVANFFLSWHGDWAGLLKEWKKVLRPNGIILFTALGIDTLKNLPVVLRDRLPHLYDMHDLGDELIKQNFADPVLDVCKYTVSYKSYEKLIKELYGSEMISTLNDLSTIPEMEADDDGKWNIEYEVIFGHAFLPPLASTSKPSADGVVHISVNQILGNKK